MNRQVLKKPNIFDQYNLIIPKKEFYQKHSKVDPLFKVPLHSGIYWPFANGSAYLFLHAKNHAGQAIYPLFALYFQRTWEEEK